MIETPRLQEKDGVTMSTESTSERCSAPSGLEWEERPFPGLTPRAFLSRRFAAQVTKPERRGVAAQEIKSRRRGFVAQVIKPGGRGFVAQEIKPRRGATGE